MSIAAAYFDMLSLGLRLSDLVEGFSRAEMHLFAYAGCLLSLYEGQPTADWGYEFVSTDNGLPFARELNECIESGVTLGHLHQHQSLIVVTADGRAELDGLRQLTELRARERYLEGATDSLLVLNPGNVREALTYDPAISFLKNNNRTDWVLTPPVVERFYENFRELRAALAYDTRDLSVPLVGWLKYLLYTGRSELNVRPATS
ncbi:MAG: hypothetical protein JO295_03915 [Verrucomicrobia bacterium]|nr:hypothetical protein [Verrucomicrobiota bacterium]